MEKEKKIWRIPRHASGFVRRRALWRIVRQSGPGLAYLACLPTSVVPVKPECDLPLILFNELPINEGNSRQR